MAAVNERTTWTLRWCAWLAVLLLTGAPATPAPTPAAAVAPAGDAGSLRQILEPIVAQFVAVREALRPALEPAVPCPGEQPPGSALLQTTAQNLTTDAPPCGRQPSPLSEDVGPHREPAQRACARSCLQLRDQATSPLTDGVYWLTGLPAPVYCDFSHDGGGWTLLLTAATGEGWDVLAARGREELSPSLTDNYSILRWGDRIRDLGSGHRFAYRIEAQAEKGRRRWGGVWLAPRGYSFVHETPSQTEVALVRQFDNWVYKDDGIKQRMPWLYAGTHGSKGYHQTVLSTADYTSDWWGTLVTKASVTSYQHSPWIHPEAQQSGTILYWMRENED